MSSGRDYAALPAPMSPPIPGEPSSVVDPARSMRGPPSTVGSMTSQQSRSTGRGSISQRSSARTLQRLNPTPVRRYRQIPPRQPMARHPVRQPPLGQVPYQGYPPVQYASLPFRVPYDAPYQNAMYPVPYSACPAYPPPPQPFYQPYPSMTGNKAPHLTARIVRGGTVYRVVPPLSNLTMPSEQDKERLAALNQPVEIPARVPPPAAMRDDQSHYEVLGIEPDASLQLIEAVTHLLLDRMALRIIDASSGTKMKDAARVVYGNVLRAYHVLADPDHRQEYHRRIGLCPPPSPMHLQAVPEEDYDEQEEPARALPQITSQPAKKQKQVKKPEKNPYDVLKVSPDDSIADIEEAFEAFHETFLAVRRKLNAHDLKVAQTVLAEKKRALKFLKNSKDRARYDKYLTYGSDMSDSDSESDELHETKEAGSATRLDGQGHDHVPVGEDRGVRKLEQSRAGAESEGSLEGRIAYNAQHLKQHNEHLDMPSAHSAGWSFDPKGEPAFQHMTLLPQQAQVQHHSHSSGGLNVSDLSSFYQTAGHGRDPESRSLHKAGQEDDPQRVAPMEERTAWATSNKPSSALSSASSTQVSESTAGTFHDPLLEHEQSAIAFRRFLNSTPRNREQE